MYTDISIDLETLDVSPRALVTSIGVVGFNRISGHISEGFEIHASVRSQLFRRKIGMDTIKWWLKQSEEAKTAFREGQRNSVSLKEAVKQVLAFLLFDIGIDLYTAKVWTNGPEFDEAVIEDVYKNTFKKEVPWKFYNSESVRTCRTVYEFKTGNRLKDIVPFEGVKHSALADARHQAKLVIETFKVL